MSKVKKIVGGIVIGVVIILIIIIALVIAYSSGGIKDGVDVTLFGGKTAYRYNTLEEYKDKSLDELETCTLVHVAGASRHGERYPTIDSYWDFDNLTKKMLNSKTAKSLPPGLLTWKDRRLEDAREGSLTEVGIETLLGMGSRLRERMTAKNNDLKLSLNAFETYSTSINRARNSGINFIRGLIPEANVTAINSTIKVNDIMLLFNEQCPRYYSRVSKNKTAMKEFYDFEKGSQVTAVRNALKKRFSFDDITINLSELDVIYIMCGFDVANKWVAKPEDSFWCQMLTNDERRIIAYLNDLKQYYRKSYPYEINYKMACTFARKVVDRFNEVADAINNKKAMPKMILAFAHSETIVPLGTLLNLFKPKIDLRADNYDQILEEKPEDRWESSKVQPFAVNMILEVYSCTKLGAANEYRILPRYNERTVSWPICGGKTHCSLDEFTKAVTKVCPVDFDFNKLCNP